MAPKRILAIIAFGVAATSPFGFGQSPSPSPLPEEIVKDPIVPHSPERPGRPGTADDQRMKMVKPERLLQNVPPDQREQLRNNLNRWREMPPGQKDTLREEAERRRQEIHTTVERAIKESGLTLSKDEREIYELRYTQERRKIEQQLRKEAEEKRNALLKEAEARLKDEFSAKQSQTATPVPISSPSPAKE